MSAVLDMTWREFSLRRRGWEREQKRQWIHTREVSYNALVATGAIDPKKTTRETFMPIEGGKSKTRMTEKQRAALKKAQQEYKDSIDR